MVSTFAVARKSDLRLDDHLDIEGEELLTEALGTTGAILVLGHMGNWELLTRYTQRLGIDVPVGALYRTLSNPYINDSVLERRQVAGMQLINSQNPIFALLRIMKKKGLVCVLSDQRIGDIKGVPTPFFGRVTWATRLPQLIHERTLAPVITVSMSSQELGKWKLSFQKVEAPSQENIISDLADGMKGALSDCFWFQDRWQEFPKQDLYEYGLENEVEVTSVTPWVVESEEALRQISEYLWVLDPQRFPVRVWSRGDAIEDCYFGVGVGREFRKACRKVGLKRGLFPVHWANNHFIHMAKIHKESKPA